MNNLAMMGPAIVGVPVFVRVVLNRGAGVYAGTSAVYAAGMFVGAALVARFGQRVPKGRLLLAGIVLDGLTLLPLAYTTSVAGLYVTIAAHALATPLIVISRPAIIQTLVPEELRGRVFGMISVAVAGFSALSIAFTGAMLEIVSPHTVFAVSGALAAGTGLVGWALKDLRRTT